MKKNITLIKKDGKYLKGYWSDQPSWTSDPSIADNFSGQSLADTETKIREMGGGAVVNVLVTYDEQETRPELDCAGFYT